MAKAKRRFKNALERITVRSKRDARRKYVVTKFENGTVRCSCPQYIYRLNGTSGKCKHILSVGM